MANTKPCNMKNRNLVAKNNFNRGGFHDKSYKSQRSQTNAKLKKMEY